MLTVCGTGVPSVLTVCGTGVPPMLTVIKIYTYPTLIRASKLATAFLNF